MPRRAAHKLSMVIPVYNEQLGLASFHGSLIKQLDKLSKYSFEIIYCNDGSTDQTLDVLQKLARRDKRVKVLSLSRNFGKEIATTAGIHMASGRAVITLDADGQHPVQLIKQFIDTWENGSKTVIGLRLTNKGENLIKRYGSLLFYAVFNRMTGLKLVPGATDFRLIDETVRADFIRMTERNRITRGLIDWLGYARTYIPFDANPRLQDNAGYSFRKLCKLAIDSVISLSSSPLYITAYIGIVVLPASLLLGVVMIANGLLSDPLGWQVTGGAYVMVFTLFLVGIIMMSQGIIGLYLSHIHSETQNRPLYIIDLESSKRI